TVWVARLAELVDGCEGDLAVLFIWLDEEMRGQHLPDVTT
ncbi:Protein of unknown function, partial [Gryllus bimaculatus]